MKFISNTAESRKIDALLIQEKCIPGIILMEQAAMAVCKEVMQDFPQPCTVLCIAGKGNNGGDALAVGRILEMYGYTVHIGVISQSLPTDASVNLQYFLRTDRVVLLDDTSLDTFFAQSAQVVIDGLLGVGLARPVQGLYAEIIAHMERHPAAVYAIDIPSGVSADTGEAVHAVHATKTITFCSPKYGHLLYPGRMYCGTLIIAPIAPQQALEGLFSPQNFWIDEYTLPRRNPNTHKSNYGRLAILAGSKGMAGAAVLCTKAAIAGGAGLTTFMGCRYVADIMQQTAPVAMAKDISDTYDYLRSNHVQTYLHGFNAVVLGPGFGQHEGSIPVALEVAVMDIPKVIDADALNLLAQEAVSYGDNTVITPHPGEFARLSGLSVEEILQSPIESAKAYAREYGVTVLLKGTTTVVTNGEVVYLVTSGTPGMAKGGSGDVLSGVIGALLAQGFSAIESAYGGAYLCGKAAELAAQQYGEYAMTPKHTIEFLGKVM